MNTQVEYVGKVGIDKWYIVLKGLIKGMWYLRKIENWCEQFSPVSTCCVQNI